MPGFIGQLVKRQTERQRVFGEDALLAQRVVFRTRQQNLIRRRVNTSALESQARPAKHTSGLIDLATTGRSDQ